MIAIHSVTPRQWPQANRWRLHRARVLPSAPDRRWLCRVWPQIHDNAVRLPTLSMPRLRSVGTWLGSSVAGSGALLGALLLAR